MDEVTSPEVGTVEVVSDEGLGNEQLESGSDNDSEFVGDEVEQAVYELDGVSYTEDELRNGILRQQDYTKKTQEVATQRQQLEAAERVWNALQADPEGTLAYLQEQLGLNAIQDTQDDTEDLDPVERLQREFDALKAQQRDAQQLAEIKSEVADLKARRGEFNEDELFEFAVQRKIPNLEDALDLMQTRAASKKKTAAKQDLPPVAGGSRAAGSSGRKTTALPSFKEALEETLAEMGLTELPAH